jgi:uncharacterized membrane protein
VDYSQVHYLPLALPFFAILIGALIVLVVLLQIGVLKYAYSRLGLSPGAAYLLLFGSLVGSYFNIPLGEMPGHNIVEGAQIRYFGMDYIVPMIAHRPGTIIAVNVGGAVIPGLMSLYLLARHGLWTTGLIATALVAAICHRLATPVPGLGIALPVFVPAIATALVAILLSRKNAAPLAYIAGSLGVLIGADLLNLGRIQGLGAPVASIGGAGTFDGIFLCGILAVLLASLSGQANGRGKTQRSGRA